MTLFSTHPPRRILIISLRFLGDTLLTTPLIRSLKQAYPQARLDVLVYRNAAAMLEGNPDISQIIGIDSKPKPAVFMRLLARLWRRYDLAVSTQSGDRPTLFAVVAGHCRVGFVPPKPQTGWWKRYVLSKWLEFGSTPTHTVLENLRLCELLNIPRCYAPVPPRSLQAFLPLPNPPYAVLHIVPQWTYKQWHRSGWVAVAHFLTAHGYQVVLSGSSSPQEQRLLADLLPDLPPTCLDWSGQLSLGQWAKVIAHAALFIGTDTGITHLAAATGVPTVALFGPTDPMIWSPWPQGYAENTPPFAPRGNQQVANVVLIQGITSKNCVPCQQEGCDRHRDSHSACLDDLSAESVIAVLRDWVLPKSD